MKKLLEEERVIEELKRRLGELWFYLNVANMFENLNDFIRPALVHEWST